MTNDSDTKATILMVGDDAPTDKRAAILLEAAGYDVRSVSNLNQGLEVAARIRPELILMDLCMPDLSEDQKHTMLNGQSGLGDIPVIFITASIEEKDLEVAFKLGGSDFVHKPIRRIELLTRVERILELEAARQKLTEDGVLRRILENAGTVCHNLNQPLQYAMGATQILLMDISPDDPKFNQLDAIRGKIEQMAEITKELADLTRYRTPPADKP